MVRTGHEQKNGTRAKTAPNPVANDQ